MKNLASNEYHPFYKPYLLEAFSYNLSLIELLKLSELKLIDTLQSLSTEKQKYRYEKNKWSIKEILQHLIDTERIFTYRALRFARNDKTVLSGFDENYYVVNSFCEHKNFKELIKEFKQVRACTYTFFKGLDLQILKNKGVVNENNLSVRAIGYIISGHQLHHLQVIKKKYL